MTAAGPDPAAPLHRRTGLLVGLHLAAVVVAYALALALGGGIGALPMPPDLKWPAATPEAGPGPRPVALPGRDAEPPLPGVTDIAPPWATDRDGHVRLRAE